MELNMPNPDALDFPEAFGITPERQNELSKFLDAMVKSWKLDTVLRVQHIIADIAFFCEGPEEFAYCVVLHMGWWQRRGHALAPR
jgi:hypothetical protein